MTTEMWIIAAVRLAGSLPVLRWPFYGALIAIAVDQSDLFLMNLLDLGGVRDYQTFDKYLDQAYMAVFLIVALRWESPLREVSAGLYTYRFVGFVLFEATQSRSMLLLFPNFFEPWFMLIAGLKHFRVEVRWTDPRLIGAVVVLAGVKVFQEYAIHYERWLDGFTAVEAVEAAWRWLTGPLS
jgi:hypothetical protein